MKKVLPSLFALAILGYLVYNVYQHRNSFSSVDWNFTIWGIVLLFTVSIFVYFLNTLSWHILCRSLSINIKFPENSAIWMVSNVSRLIPGGVWQYPSRALFLSRHGVSNTRSVVAMTMEGLLTISSGAAVVIASAPFMDISDTLTQNTRLLLFVGIAAPVLPIFLLRTTVVAVLLKKIGSLFKKDLGTWQTIKLSPLWTPLLIISFVGRFLMLGWGLFILAGFTTVLHPSMFLTLTGIFALSWLAGYLAFFSPGGIGVTEASLSILLSSYLPLGVAITIAVAYRLVLMLGEGIYLWVSLHRVKHSRLTPAKAQFILT